MQLLLADWILLAFALAMAVLGLFRGLSGTIAFFAALASAGGVAVAAWGISAGYLSAEWQRGGVTLLAALLAFGIVRLILKKFIHVLLAQPTDAIAGMLCGAVFGLVPVAVWAKTGLWLEYSSLTLEVARYVR